MINPDGELIYIIHRVEDVTEFIRLKTLGKEQELLTQELKVQAEKMEAEIFLRTQQVAQSSRQLKESNLEPAKLNDKLEAANKELESFSFSVSHDLRAPLRAIDGFARILREEHAAKLDPEGHRLLDVVCTNVQKMGRLIDDLLAFSRLGRQPLQSSSVDMGNLVQMIFDELQKQNPERKIQLSLGALEPIQGDPMLLRQVWVNLLSNAIKYTRPRADAVIKVSSRTNEEEVIYEIYDNGVGFDNQYVGKLFGVFQRLHKYQEFEGTGVGLAIVKQIAVVTAAGWGPKEKLTKGQHSILRFHANRFSAVFQGGTH